MAEFKQEAVRQVEQEGEKPAQVARGLGIAEQMLPNWRKATKGQAGRPQSGYAEADGLSRRPPKAFAEGAGR